MRVLDLAQGKISPEESFVDALLFGQKYFRVRIPKILSFYPAAYNNPFQQILYSQAKENSITLAPYSDFEDLGKINWGDSSWIHIHWLKKILEKSTSKKKAEETLGQFERKLSALRKGGHKILWTIHNVLPHETQLVESEVKLRKILCSYAHKIHILTGKTIELCSPYYKVPEEKTFLTPHPLYTKHYPCFVDQQTARYELNLSDDSVYLFFGSLDPYKNIEFILDAVSQEPEKYKRRVYLLAGKPSSKEYLETLSEKIKKSKANIILHPKQIPFERVQLYFKSADALILPYGNTLNSGVASLARGFDLPLISPKTSCTEELYGKTYPFFFEDQNAKDFCHALDQFEKEKKSKHLLKREKTDDEISQLFFNHL